MFEIRAGSFELDLIRSGVLEAYGEAGVGVCAFRFDDREFGFFRAAGGLIGSGGVTVTKYATTSFSFRLPCETVISYDKALSGSAYLGHRETALTTQSGVAIVSSPGAFDIAFRPSRWSMRGVVVTLSIEALNTFMDDAGESGTKSIVHTLINNSGSLGPDAALLGLVGYVLTHFDRYRFGEKTKAARLAEALITETFIQLLRDIGAVRIQGLSHGAGADAVRRAEEYIIRRFNSPLTVAEVAAAVNVSLRRLEAAFRKHRDTTPREYLTSVRLERAREMLKRPTWPATVTAIAHDCGIFHLSRFAHQYMMKYDEFPSQTLRRSIHASNGTHGN